MENGRTKISVRKTDIIWNYVGTILSLSSGFLLLPILLLCLTEEELGLWYVFLAIGNLTQLFEFGFNPTFSRNLIYCLSGATKLSREGAVEYGDSPNWKLMAAVVKTSKLMYALIALVTLALVLSVGTAYVSVITNGMAGSRYWMSWAVFALAIFFNLFFLWTLTCLRGCGDIAGENKAKTFSRLGQLAVTAVLGLAGLGLLGASLGYLASGLLLRFFAHRELNRHPDILSNIRKESAGIGAEEIKEVLRATSNLAIKDGVVQLSMYFSTQAASIVASLFLSLSETGVYSIQLQFANAVASVSVAYMASCLPSYQSAFAVGDRQKMVEVAERGYASILISGLLLTVGVVLIAFPVLSIIRPGYSINVPLFVVMAVYSCGVQRCSITCSLIAATNRIPYVGAYATSSIMGVVLASLFVGLFKMGAWGLIIGQLIAQFSYNVWRWPHYVAAELGRSIPSLTASGYDWWKSRVVARMRSFIEWR